MNQNTPTPHRLFHTPNGTIGAYYRNNLLEALGIPYARAKRFHHPHPVKTSDYANPYHAYQPAPAAPQHIRGNNTKDIRHSPYTSEDCQNLSIIMPADIAPDEALPVMVYIHGGSYVVGSGDGARYNPDKLIHEHRLIVIRITYRLGILGFLGGTKDRPANLGLLDVREALRWIKTNITHFGGNPNNITLFGQSAGGDLIARLLISEGVVEEELLHRAIIQSAPLSLIYNKQKMVGHMHHTINKKLTPNAPAQDYGNLSYTMQNQNPLRYGPYRPLMAFGTQPGHYPLPPENQLDQALTAVAGKVDILIGSNTREAAYFIPHTTHHTTLKLLEPGIKHYTHHLYTKPAQEFTTDYRQAGGNATRYQLTTGNPLHPLASAHCTELALLFDNPTWNNSNLHAGTYPWERQPQATAFRTIWATFAANGTIPTHHTQQAKITLH